MFENLVQHLEAQKAEADELRQQLQLAHRQAMEANERASAQLQRALEEERENAEADRDNLLSQIKLLLEESGQKQAARLKGKVDGIRSDMESSRQSLEQADATYGERMDEWMRKEDAFVEEVTSTRDAMKTKMQDDWTVRFTHMRSEKCANSVRSSMSAMLPSKKRQNQSMKRRCALWMLK